MALINCPECGKPDVSDAGTCPGCGFPIGETKNNAEKIRKEQLEDYAQKARAAEQKKWGSQGLCTYCGGTIVNAYQKESLHEGGYKWWVKRCTKCNREY